MRVLVLFRSRVLEDSGTPLRARNLVRNLGQLPGVEVMLLSQDDSTAVQHSLSIPHHQLDRQSSLPAQLSRCSEDFQPDVVYGQTHKGMEVLANARDSLQKPKLVVDLHGDLAVEQLERADHSLIWRWHWYGRTRFKERKNMTHMSAFTAVSHNLLQYPQSLKKPAIVLWGGVDLEKFQPTTLPPSAHIQVAYAGNYRPYQGVSILLQAAQHLIRAGEPFHFTFIGDMEAFPKQAALAHSLGNRVTLTGPVPFAQVPAWLGKADILVTPRAPGRSAYYNYPSKLSEQLAMGKAVIVTDVGEAGRLVQDGKTGLLIRPNSVDAMIEALLRLKDEPLRQQLGWAARAFAEEHLAWPRLAEKLAAFFQELSRAPAQV